MCEVWTIGWPSDDSNEGFVLYPEAFPSRQAAVRELVQLNAETLLRGEDNFLVLVDRLSVFGHRLSVAPD